MKAKNKLRIQLENREPLDKAIPLSTPWVIGVEPTDVCNFRCKFCPSSDVKLLRSVGRPRDFMRFPLFKKIVDDICEFDKPIKVLRLYKDGEPLLNSNFVKMVKYAKDSGCCEAVDTTTNGSMLNPKLNLEIVEAGLDRINISVNGINAEQYLEFSKYKMNFDKFVENITHLYDNRKQLEMIIKIDGDFLSEEDKQKFLDIFGDICDGIAIEHTMNCWYDFDGPKQNEEFGIYGQPIHEVEVCPYPFYSMSINVDGKVSLCFLDWARKMIIGNVKEHSVKYIWNSFPLRFYQQVFLTKNRHMKPICRNCNQLSHGMPVDLDDKAEEILLRMIKNGVSYM